MDDNISAARENPSCSCKPLPPAYDTLGTTHQNNPTSGDRNDNQQQQLRPASEVFAHLSTRHSLLRSKHLPTVSQEWNGLSHWCRPLPQPDNKFWYQCTINLLSSNLPTISTPSNSFICKVLPTPGHDEETVAKACRDTTKAMVFHRSMYGSSCNTCEFRWPRTDADKRKKCPKNNYGDDSPRHRVAMKEHDRVCSCRCFDGNSPFPVVNEGSAVGSGFGSNMLERAVQQDSNDANDTVYGDWKYHHMVATSTSEIAWWARTIKNSDCDGLWHEYGITPDDKLLSGKPDFVFTCKMMPRENQSKLNIRLACENVAHMLRLHRGLEYYSCPCDFESLRRRRGKCTLNWFNLLKTHTGRQVNKNMAIHDRVCSCGCFGSK